VSQGIEEIKHFQKSLGISSNAYAIAEMPFRKQPITLLGSGLGVRGWIFYDYLQLWEALRLG